MEKMIVQRKKTIVVVLAVFACLPVFADENVRGVGLIAEGPAGNVTLETVAHTLANTIELVLRLSGEFRVVRIDDARSGSMRPQDVELLGVRHSVENVVSISVFSENQQIAIQIRAYAVATGEVILETAERIDRLVAVFELGDRMVVEFLELYSGRRPRFGTLEIDFARLPDDYLVFVDGVGLGPNLRSIATIPVGSREIILRARDDRGTVLVQQTVEVIEDGTTVVAFDPEYTDREFRTTVSQLIERLKPFNWTIDTPDTTTTRFDRLAEIMEREPASRHTDLLKAACAAMEMRPFWDALVSLPWINDPHRTPPIADLPDRIREIIDIVADRTPTEVFADTRSFSRLLDDARRVFFSAVLIQLAPYAGEKENVSEIDDILVTISRTGAVLPSGARREIALERSTARSELRHRRGVALGFRTIAIGRLRDGDHELSGEDLVRIQSDIQRRLREERRFARWTYPKLMITAGGAFGSTRDVEQKTGKESGPNLVRAGVQFGVGEEGSVFGLQGAYAPVDGTMIFGVAGSLAFGRHVGQLNGGIYLALSDGMLGYGVDVGFGFLRTAAAGLLVYRVGDNATACFTLDVQLVVR